MNKKGFLLYELFISFAFIMIIMLIMLQTTVSLKNRQIKIMQEAKINSFNNEIINTLGKDLKDMKIVSIILSGSTYTITYNTKTVTLVADPTQGKITYDGVLYDRTVNFDNVTMSSEIIGSKTFYSFTINSSDTMAGNLTLVGTS